MEVKLLKTVAQEIGMNFFKEYGVNPDSWGWKQQVFIDLTQLSKKKILKFRSIVSSNLNVRGTKVIIKDIDTWLQALDKGVEGTHARTCRQFEPLLVRLIGRSSGYRIYERVEEMSDIYLCYYVEKIRYVEEVTRVCRGSNQRWISTSSLREDGDYL